MRINGALVVAGFALIGMAEPAAACNARLVQTTSEVRLNYDPFLLGRNVSTLPFEVDNREDTTCVATIVLLDINRVGLAEFEVPQTGVRVGFSAGAGDTDLVSSPIPGIWRVALPPGKVRLALNATVTQDAVARAGEHRKQVTLELRDEQAASSTTGSLPIDVVLAAVPRAQMNIVGAAGTFGQGAAITQVDFGELRTGASRRVFLQVRANTDARLTIDSGNRGQLRRTDATEGEAGVPYEAELMNTPVDLTRHWESTLKPPEDYAGISMPLVLTVSSISYHPAGTYSDTLVVQISAL